MVDRSSLINNIYYQELGRTQADESGLNYWLEAGKDLDDTQLRNAIRYSSGLTGTSVNEPLLADQSYAAYLRKAQFDQSEIESALAATKAAAQARIDAQRGTYDMQRKQGYQGINDSYESRGMGRAGGRLTAAADNRASIDRNQMAFQQGIGAQNAEAERSSASRIAAITRANAEQQLGARDRLTQRSVQYG